MSLVFKKIESGDIFTRDFSPLARNNEIVFPQSEEIAVVYGPNGTGKTSLIKVLGDTPNTKIEFSLDGTDYLAGAEVFHIINDQIQEIISNSMSKLLTIERDENRRLRIALSNQEFLGKTRDELPLSTGEQNFLSLTFEFLKAKNSERPIVVIDDPMSRFDSIYKNKVVYAIVKMLHHKKRIVLTHNTDLIRLLDGQYRRCFPC